DGVVDHPDRAYVFQAHVLGDGHAGCLVGIDPDDENVRLLGSESEKPEMTGMNDVEVARNKGNACGLAAAKSDRSRLGSGSVYIAFIQCRIRQTRRPRKAFRNLLMPGRP